MPKHITIYLFLRRFWIEFTSSSVSIGNVKSLITFKAWCLIAKHATSLLNNYQKKPCSLRELLKKFIFKQVLYANFSFTWSSVIFKNIWCFPIAQFLVLNMKTCKNEKKLTLVFSLHTSSQTHHNYYKVLKVITPPQLSAEHKLWCAGDIWNTEMFLGNTSFTQIANSFSMNKPLTRWRF